MLYIVILECYIDLHVDLFEGQVYFINRGMVVLFTVLLFMLYV